MDNYCEHLKSQGGHDDINCKNDPEEPVCRWDMDCDPDGTKTCVNPGGKDAKCEEIGGDVVWFPDGKNDGDWCGKITRNTKELFGHDEGCISADEVFCQGGDEKGNQERPFKHGEECNGGFVEIPAGVCVELIPLQGAWEADPCSDPAGGSERVIKKCAPDDKPLKVNFHAEALNQDKNKERVCAWKFSKNDSCEKPKSSTLQLGNTTEVLLIV